MEAPLKMSNSGKKIFQWTGIIVVLFISLIIPVTTAMGHGGKKHDAGSFTQLQALQKATQLFDRLIISGKLGEIWESGLKHVDISIRPHRGGKEYVVSFKCNKEAPDTVYFFFKSNGKYAGSNFSGK